jgi:hypothetical protein
VALRAALRRFTIEPAHELERTRRRAITISPRRGARTVLGAAARAQPRSVRMGAWRALAGKR